MQHYAKWTADVTSGQRGLRGTATDSESLAKPRFLALDELHETVVHSH
jgi:hypothetical protein